MDKLQIIGNILKEARVAQKALTEVQKKIIDTCEPMIEELSNKAEKQIKATIARIEEDKVKREFNEKDAYNTLREKYGDDSFQKDIFNAVFRTENYASSMHTKIQEYNLDEAAKKHYIKRTKEDIRAFNMAKLTRAITRYISSDFISVEGRITQGLDGFEFKGRLMDNQGRQWTFNTKGISAGGYNIQRFHYRYLVDLSSPEVPKERVRHMITDQEKAEKEQRKQERVDLRKQKTKEEFARKLVTLVLRIRSLVKDHYRPGYKNFSDKWINFKRQELTEKALRGEIDISIFDEIKSYLEKDISLDYDYRQLVRMAK
jgi:hypothetical protein